MGQLKSSQWGWTLGEEGHQVGEGEGGNLAWEDLPVEVELLQGVAMALHQ